MKKIIFSVVVLSAMFIGCNTDLDVNVDPDRLDPNKAALSAQLPAGIIGVIGGEGASLAIIGGMWSQFWTQSNAANQYKDIDAYAIGTADYNYAWNAMYDALGDLRNVQRKALRDGNWNYYLISTTLIVQASQVLTDYYGAIPYTEANNSAILNPVFNTGEEVYELMIADLNDALSKDLSTSSTVEVPGSDDYIYNGNMEDWTKFANTLKLKIYMRQTNSPKAAAAGAAITEMLNANTAFLTKDAGMTQFVDEINNSNPLYEFNNRALNVATNLRMSNTIASWFTENADTRRGAYYLAGAGLNQGDVNNPAGQATFAVVSLSATTPAFLMTLEESLFLQAEAMLRYKGDAGAQALYDAAVVKNFSRYSLDGSTYVAAGGAYEYPTTGTFDQKLEAIIVQKWAASFPGNGWEAFFETNRTGYPKTSPIYSTEPGYVPGHLVFSKIGSTEAGRFPKRIVYPLSERNANSNAPTIVPITVPVWWALNN